MEAGASRLQSPYQLTRLLFDCREPQLDSTTLMRRFFFWLSCVLVLASPLGAQRTPVAPDSASRAEFVGTVRDMAAWALVTPAAHIPVGGILDERGNVASVVGTLKETTYTPDTVLAAFRKDLSAATRRQNARAFGLGYIVRRAAPNGARVIDAVMVEVEYRNGYRTRVMFPYTRDEAGQPVFGEPITGAGTATRDVAVGPTLEESARRIVAAVPYPTFITNDASGRPQARTVQTQPPDSTWTVWFATNPRTRKVAEVQRDARVVLHYFDQSTLSYVSLVGRARVVRDRATKDAHWNAAWTAFYPDRDSSVVLIAVQAERLEIVSTALGIAGDAATWRPPTIQLPRRGVPPR